MNSDSVIRAWSTEWCGRNPNCSPDSAQQSSKYALSWSKASLSKILDTTFKREKGRWFDAFLGSPLPLKIETTSAIFKQEGTTPLQMDKLKMWSSGEASRPANRWNREERPSGPDVVWRRSDWITDRSSECVAGRSSDAVDKTRGHPQNTSS